MYEEVDKRFDKKMRDLMNVPEEEGCSYVPIACMGDVKKFIHEELDRQRIDYIFGYSVIELKKMIDFCKSRNFDPKS